MGYALLIKRNGAWFCRCNDGKWRNEPWFGNLGWCLKTYKTEKSAKGAFSRICLNSILTSFTEHWITELSDKSCSEFWHRTRKGKPE